MANISEYGSAELPPEGFAHPAMLVGFVDLGVQEGKFGSSRQASLTFELLDEKTADGKPMLARKQIFNLSARSKNFREILRALTGLHDVALIEARELLGKECCLAIEHTTTDTGTFADVEVKQLRGKPSGKRPGTPMTFFSLHPSDFEPRALDGLPEWMRERIKKSSTYAQTQADLKLLKEMEGKTASEVVKDSVPDSSTTPCPPTLTKFPGTSQCPALSSSFARLRGGPGASFHFRAIHDQDQTRFPANLHGTLKQCESRLY